MIMDQYSYQFKTESDSIAISVGDVVSNDEVWPDEKFALKDISSSCSKFDGPNYSMKSESTLTDSSNDTKANIKTEVDSSGELSDDDQFIDTCPSSVSKFDDTNYSMKSESTLRDSSNETKDDIKTEGDSSDELSDDDQFIDTCVKAEELSFLDSNEDGDYAEINTDQYKMHVKEEELDIKDEEYEAGLENYENVRSNTLGTKDESKKIYKCHTCNFGTANYGSYKKHALLHEDPNKVPLYYCTMCSYRTKQKCHLRRHDLVHQNASDIPMYSCDICGLKTKQRCTLKRHLESVHIKTQTNLSVKNELFSCTECSFQTHKRGLIISHMDKHKDTSDVSNLYICDICSFSTKYRKNLRMHLDTHKDRKKLRFYECELCNFSSRMSKCLTRHLLSKKHLKAAGKLAEYRPRGQKL